MFKIIENSTITKENFNTLSDTLDRLHAVLEAADYDAEFSLITDNTYPTIQVFLSAETETQYTNLILAFTTIFCIPFGSECYDGEIAITEHTPDFCQIEGYIRNTQICFCVQNCAE